MPEPTNPPRTLLATFAKLGPGMIIAGSIVGSGELIATTKVGAEAGFWLLWLIVVGCVIKVFTQVEMGRYTITWSETPLEALNKVPGPRWKVNWVVWYWAVMTLLIVSQQGGIVGGVGQALSISWPLTEQGALYNDAQNERVRAQVDLAMADGGDTTALQERFDRATEAASPIAPARDSYIWATIVAAVTSVLMYFGRFGLIQAVSTILVVLFTLVTVLTVSLLQFTEFAVTGAELGAGFRFSLPPADVSSGVNPMITALAAFGIIGMGAGELLMYPYWCLEKGYARSTGRRDDSPQWLERARGWIRVLQLDAWFSAIVYTFATVAFYLLGAAVLWRTGLNPAGADMVRTLSEMYGPVFGPWSQGVFLFGAFAVLYSTFFVVAAGYSRLVADGLGLFGFHDGSEATRMRWTRWISCIWPFLALGTYLFFQAPVAMVLASGVAQAVMLPMLGTAALFFRYRRADERLKPGRVWDVMLWISCLGFLIVGVWSLYNTLA